MTIKKTLHDGSSRSVFICGRFLLVKILHDVVVRAVSFWEISLKYSNQKLTLEGLTPEDIPKAAVETGFRLIELSGEIAASYHRLSVTYHRDPFDRMLIWQALHHDFRLISKDYMVMKYASEGLTVIG